MLPQIIGSVLIPLIDLIGGKLGVDMSSDDTKIKLAEIELEAQKLVQGQMTAQTDINKVEATNPNVFVSGWRPFIGWTCGVAFCYHFLLQPFILLLLSVLNHPINDLPVFDMTTLDSVLMGMLGLGALRTYEKTKQPK